MSEKSRYPAQTEDGTGPTPYRYLEFAAVGGYRTEHSHGTWRSGDSKHLLQTALRFALKEHGPEMVRAEALQLIERYAAAQGRPRREMGDLVVLDGSKGFGAQSGVYRIVGRDEPDDCVVCDVETCREWPTLERVDANGQGTGEYAYHVSECGMESVKK